MMSKATYIDATFDLRVIPDAKSRHVTPQSAGGESVVSRFENSPGRI